MSRTMVICSHQDDEALSAGGLIMKRLEGGGKVLVMTMFGRSYNYGEGDQHIAEQLDAFKNSMRALGEPDWICFHREEGEPQKAGYYGLLKDIERYLREYDPTEVVVHSARDLNQDHRWLAEVCRIALRPANLGNTTRILTMLGIDGRLSPDVNFYVPLTELEMGLKLSAMSCYARESRMVPHPRAPETLLAYHRLVGSQCGEVFAEPYVLTFQK